MADETRLVFIRHGASRASADHLVGGHAGCRGLTEEGRAQAHALHDRLRVTRELVADVLYSSVLPRAIETAEILNPALGDLDIRQDCDLCELHPGECDGLSWSEYRERYGFDMLAEPTRPMSPGGESARSFQKRVEERLERLVDDHRGKSVVVICHGGVVCAATFALLATPGMDRVRPFGLYPENTSITEWVRPGAGARHEWVLERYNDAAHLAGVAQSGVDQ